MANNDRSDIQIPVESKNAEYMASWREAAEFARGERKKAEAALVRLANEKDALEKTMRQTRDARDAYEEAVEALRDEMAEVYAVRDNAKVHLAFIELQIKSYSAHLSGLKRDKKRLVRLLKRRDWSKLRRLQRSLKGLPPAQPTPPTAPRP